MKLLRTTFMLLMNVIFINCAVYSPSGGPVYVNPNAAPVEIEHVVATKQNNPGHYETQYVYGFLDFTTTIGNTVMIFSPQSAAPVLTEPPPTTTTTTEAIAIQTQPPTTPAPLNDVFEIKPSKTIVKSTPVKEVDVSSVVHIVEVTPATTTTTTTTTAKTTTTTTTTTTTEEPEVKPIKVVTTSTTKTDVVTPKIVQVIAETPKPKTAKPKPQPKSSKVQFVSSVVEKTTETTPAVIEVTPAMKEIITEAPEVEEPIESEEDEEIVDDAVPEAEPHYSSVEIDPTSEEEPEPEPVLQIENNIAEPEYDFLSRQPSEFAEETFRVTNLKPSIVKPAEKASAKPKRISNQANKDETHPTGLVTKLGGTVVKDGVTTVHETSVIGTYISGKYAQVLQSTSHLFQGSNKPKPTSSSSLRILKTAAPNVPKSTKFIVEATPSSSIVEDTGLPIENIFANQPSSNLIRPSRRPAIPSAGSFKNRFRNRSSKDEDSQDAPEEVTPTPSVSYGNGKKSSRIRSTQTAKPNKNVELATVSVFSETSTPTYSVRRNKASRLNGFKPTASTTAVDAYTRRGFKPKIQPSHVEQDSQSTSLYKFKLNRSPGRWQYKTSPKPRVSIRKNEGKDSAEIPTPNPNSETSVQYNDVTPEKQVLDNDLDLDSSGSVNGDVLNDEETSDNVIERRFPIETIKVEISTPVDFKDTYFEIATIKSPYTFQVGTLKNTRYITVTSTFEKMLEQETSTVPLTEPLTENILATTSHIDKEHNLLDSSIATLPPISLASDVETPPLETLTETFSTTQIMLKTHILPVIRGGTDTTSYTLIQTYHVTRLVTATKTLPPMELYQFVPSKTLHEFNSRLDEAGSELHLELEFGDENEHDDEDAPRRELPSDLDLSNIGSDFDLSEVDKTNIPENIRPKKKISNHNKDNKITTEAPIVTPSLTQEQLQQLAYLRLLNPAAAAQIPNVITSSKPVIKLETIYESHILPVINGLSTAYSTLSRAVGTITKTDYELVTTTLQALPLPPVPQLNPFAQQQPQQYQLQSTPVVTQTMITEVNSKILKLTFGAKTAYTTLFSTKVVPTVLTSYLTQSVAVQPTAQFPGYFPSPYAPFPYVG